MAYVGAAALKARGLSGALIGSIGRAKYGGRFSSRKKLQGVKPLGKGLIKRNFRALRGGWSNLAQVMGGSDKSGAGGK